MTITANQIEKVNAVEGQKVEFETSAFYAPGEKNPGFKRQSRARTREGGAKASAERRSVI